MTCAKCLDCGNWYDIGDWPFCPHGKTGAFFSGDAQIHSSEKVSVLHNPSTGETRIPGRADRAIHPKYKAAGFTEYKTIDTHTQLRSFEKQKGIIHEGSHFDSGSGRAERETGAR